MGEKPVFRFAPPGFLAQRLQWRRGRNRFSFGRRLATGHRTIFASATRLSAALAPNGKENRAAVDLPCRLRIPESASSGDGEERAEFSPPFGLEYTIEMPGRRTPRALPCAARPFRNKAFQKRKIHGNAAASDCQLLIYTTGDPLAGVKWNRLQLARTPSPAK
jgi:hypothetical protein